MLIHLDDYRKRRITSPPGVDQQARGDDDAGVPAMECSAAVIIFRKPRRCATEGLSVIVLEGIYPLASRY